MRPDVGVVRKPVWTSSSFLLYAGGLTVLGSAIGALSFLSGEYGQGAYAAWTLLPLCVLYAVSFDFRRRGQWIAAGIFAVAGLAMWAAFVGALETWWGWLPTNAQSAFGGWHWGALLLAALVFAGSLFDLRLFRFPLLVVFTAVSAWYAVTDLLSSGGSWSAVLTLLIGLVYLAIGRSLDRGLRRPYGFWLHLVAGLLVGGALLYWWHSSEADWALVATTGVVFVCVAAATHRSTWAVLGVAGFAAAATHWANEWASTGFNVLAPNRNWVPPLVFGVVGFFFVALGLLVERRRQPA
jgi:hypothetical protein